MNSQDIYNLSEAYNQVYQVDEDAGIVSGLVGLALGAKGALHAARKTKRLRDYPKNFVKGIADPRTYVPKKKKDTNEQVDIYDIILSHLIGEGYADTEQAALVIMVNMSEEWRESIVENVSSGRSKVRNVKQRVSSAEIISNTQKQNKIAQHFADHAAKKKSAGDEAHAAATKAGKSPSDAETARNRAHREYEKQLKRG